jgi:hypothetical protein
MKWTRVPVFAPLLCTCAALAQPLPVLEFVPPQGFTGSLGKDPSTHVSRSGEAIVTVYPFRRLNGPFAEQFRRTLLREVLQHDSQEARLAGAPEIQALAVPGAEAAMSARFVEDRFGTARYRLRLAIYSGGAVALVDYNAKGPQAYQENWPALAGVLDSLKVGAAAQQPAQAAAKPAPRGVDGLYLGSTRRYVMRIGGPPGSGEWQVAQRFYLLSPDGRFHRGYDLPSVPGGDLRRFDYAKAQREDAPNTGTFTVSGKRVTLRPAAGDAMEGELAGAELRIDSMTFKKASPN